MNRKSPSLTVDKKTTKKSLLLAIMTSLLTLCTACQLPGNILSGAQDWGSLVLDHSPSHSAQEAGYYQLSPEQQDLIRSSGYPDRFLILFYQEEGSQQTEPVRFESWYYDLAGREVTFKNGSVFLDSPYTPPELVGVGRTYYNPEMFSSAMGLDQITTAVGQNEFYRIPLLEDNSSSRELVYFQGLVAGLQNDRLMYLETLPIGAAGLPYQNTQEIPDVSQ